MNGLLGSWLMQYSVYFRKQHKSFTKLNLFSIIRIYKQYPSLLSSKCKVKYIHYCGKSNNHESTSFTGSLIFPPSHSLAAGGQEDAIPLGISIYLSCCKCFKFNGLAMWRQMNFQTLVNLFVRDYPIYGHAYFTSTQQDLSRKQTLDCRRPLSA